MKASFGCLQKRYNKFPALKNLVKPLSLIFLFALGLNVVYAQKLIPDIFYPEPVSPDASQKSIDSLYTVYRSLPDEAKQYAFIFDFYQGLSGTNSELKMALADRLMLHADNTWEKAVAQYSKARSHQLLFNMDKAIGHYYDAMKFAREIDFNTMLSDIYCNLGRIQLVLHDRQKSNEYYRSALDYAEKTKDTFRIAKCYEGLASLLVEYSKYDSARRLVKTAIGYFSEYAKSDEVKARLVLAVLYMKQFKTMQALSVLDSCIKSAREHQLSELILVSIIYKSDVLLFRQEYDEAKKLLNRALSSVENRALGLGVDYSYFLTIIYRNLYRIEKMQENHAESLEYLEKYLYHKTALDARSKNIEIRGLEAEFRLEQLQKDKVILEQNAEISRKQNLIKILLVVLIASVLILLINRQRLKIKKEREYNKVRMLHAEQQVLRKNRELKAYIDKIREKNELINKFEQDIDLQNAERQKKIAEIQKLKILTDEDWITYKRLYSEVYPNFFKKLEKHHPNLTESDQRLFILIEMGFSRKEQAGILGVSPSTIRQYVFRLKKKLDLDQQTDPEGYIREFTGQ